MDNNGIDLSTGGYIFKIQIDNDLIYGCLFYQFVSNYKFFSYYLLLFKLSLHLTHSYIYLDIF